MARPKSETATIKDIAREANVSPSTVSRVLNNPGYEVGEVLRSRVFSAAERLEYRQVSRMRESRIRGHLGVILPNVTNPMYAQALTGIETIARDYDCGVSVGISLRDPDREFDYLSEMFHKKILSVILSPVSSHVEGLKEFIERGMRVVLLDQRLPDIACNHIDYNLSSGVRLAVRHLTDIGHARIGLASLPLTRWNREQVWKGYQEALTLSGIRYRDARVYVSEKEASACVPEGDFAAGYELGNRLAAAPLDITAIVVLNGSMACGLLAAFKNNGIRVPEQLSVISLEDVPGASLFCPSLTALQLPAFAVGQMAATLLISKLGMDNPTLQSSDVRPHLILRESTRRLDPPERRFL